MIINISPNALAFGACSKLYIIIKSFVKYKYAGTYFDFLSGFK